MPTREEIKARILARRDAQLQEDLRALLSTHAGRRIAARVSFELAIRHLDHTEDLFAASIKEGGSAHAHQSYYIGKQALGEAFENELREASPEGWDLMIRERNAEYLLDRRAIEQGDDSDD